MRVAYLLAAAAVVAAVPLGLLGVEHAAAERVAAERAKGTETLCDFSDPSERMSGGGRVALIAAGALGLLAIRRLARHALP